MKARTAIPMPDRADLRALHQALARDLGVPGLCACGGTGIVQQVRTEGNDRLRGQGRQREFTVQLPCPGYGRRTP